MLKVNRNNIVSGILLIGSTAGVIATGIASAIATYRAEKRIREKEEKGEWLTRRQKIFMSIPQYLPALAICGGTIASMFLSDQVNKQTQAILLGSIASLDRRLRDCQEALTDEEKERVTKAIIEKHIKDVSREDLGEKLLFYDTYGERYFNRTMAEVIDAEYHTNRNFILRGSSTLNHFYEFLGLDPIPIGDIYGWDGYMSEVYDGMYWIDYEHDLVKLEDGMECYVINYPFEPYNLVEAEEQEKHATWPVEFPRTKNS